MQHTGIFKFFAGVLLTGTSLLATGLVAHADDAPSPSSSPSPSAIEEPEFTIVSGGDEYAGDEADAYPSAEVTSLRRLQTKTRGKKMHPNYNPITIGICNHGYPDTEVSSFTSTDNGTIKLYCGSDLSSGYNHIRSGHQNDWQQVLNKYSQPGNWDDLMDFVSRNSLKKRYGSYPLNVGNNKVCYSYPFKIEDSNNKVIATYYPTVVISANNKLLITSIPTHATPNCKAV